METITKAKAAPPATEKRPFTNRENTTTDTVEAQAEISVFSSMYEKKPTSKTTIQAFLNDTISGKYQAQISKIKDAVKAGDESLKKRLKGNLAAVTLSGNIDGERTEALIQGRMTHSGLLQIDLDDDGLGSLSPEETRKIVGEDQHVLASWLSPTGTGVKALFAIPICETEEQHLAAFFCVQRYFLESYNLKLDESCKDSVRLCYVSADPEAVVKDEAVVMRITNVEPIRDRPAAPKVSSTGFPEPPKGKGVNEWTFAAARHCRADGMKPDDAASKIYSYESQLYRPLDEKEVRRSVGRAYASPEIPDDVFPVPAGGIGNNAAAEIIFPVMGEARKLFIRGTTVHEIATTEDSDHLAQVSPERFCSIVETVGKRIARREKIKGEDGTARIVWRKTTFPLGAAKIILEADAARTHLPPIRQLANCPIITPDCEILGRGYHDHAGGTYISSGITPEPVLKGIAFMALKDLLCDFDFPTDSDFSRAFASLISPALKMGGWIQDDFPLDMAEADQSQSGKTFRQKLVCRIYNEIPTTITVAKGGVGSIDEKISGALVKGRPFITLGNIRGKLDSTILEEALRGSGRVNCRTLRNSAEVDCKPFLWQLSTNGADLTRDLANRSVVTRIRKQPDSYEWRRHPEGDLETHVIKNQSFYLSCVFSIIREWHRKEKPMTMESRHDFRGWCRALDGIIGMCGLKPLLDGHREQQERTANPQLQWLRKIILATRSGDYGRELLTHDLVNIGEDNGIEFPGNPYSKDEPTIRAGRILGKIFRDAETDEIEIDGFTFTRNESPDYSENGQGRTVKKYIIQKTSNP